MTSATTQIPEVPRDRPERPHFIPRWVPISAVVALAVLAIVLASVMFFSERNLVDVPDVVGLTDSVATVNLTQAGLSSQIGERIFDPSPPGTVLAQEPPAGTRVTADTIVVLTVSAGTEEFIMPDVLGMPLRIAQSQLEAQGVTVRVEQEESDAAKDTVISTNPSPGATVRTGDIVRLTVAVETREDTALLPYDIEGITLALDPSPMQEGQSDVTLEVARRLRSLLEASGATVVLTRSLTSTDTTPAGRAAAVPTEAKLVVGLDVISVAPPGLAVRTVVSGGSSVSADTQRLADSILAQLREGGTPATTGQINADEVTAGRALPAVRIVLGSTIDNSDMAAFRDPVWADELARRLYRGLGEYLTTP